MAHLYIALISRKSFRRQRLFRDRTQLLDVYSNERLIRDFRFPREEIFKLVQLVGVLPKRTQRSKALSPELEVLAALRFFARGTYQDDVKEIIGISQQTVSRCISTFCDSMILKLRDVVKFPSTEQEMNLTKEGFLKKFGFPDVIGLIDGTHVWLKSPPPDREFVYVCRKGGHTINVQVVCDSDMIITDVVAKWPGSNHDSYIWSQSGLRERFWTNPPPGYLLGDSGYPLEPWLRTAYDNPTTQKEKKFNSKFVVTRNLVERTIGLWKNVFRVIHKDAGVLEYEPEKVAKMIMVSAMLHNLRRKLKLPEDEAADVTTDDDPYLARPSSREALQLHGRKIRDNVANKL